MGYFKNVDIKLSNINFKIRLYDMYDEITKGKGAYTSKLIESRNSS